jgi:hypothetical protein
MTAFPGACVGWCVRFGAQQLCQRQIDRIRQFDQILERRVSQRALDPGQIGSVHVGRLGKLFLRPFPLTPQFAETVAEGTFCLQSGNQTPIVEFCRL